MASIKEKLREAAKSGSEAKLKALLGNPGCDALAQDLDGMTALMYAAYYGHEACVRLLIPVSDVLGKSVNGQTALMWAAYHGHEACIWLLLRASDALNKDMNGQTSLMWAACRGQEECIRLLLPASDVLAKDSDGWTASAWARNNSYEILAKFIDTYALSQTERAAIEIAASPGGGCKRVARRV